MLTNHIYIYVCVCVCVCVCDLYIYIYDLNHRQVLFFSFSEENFSSFLKRSDGFFHEKRRKMFRGRIIYILGMKIISWYWSVFNWALYDFCNRKHQALSSLLGRCMFSLDGLCLQNNNYLKIYSSEFSVSLSTQSQKWEISCQFDDNASRAPLVSFSEDGLVWFLCLMAYQPL